MSDKIALCTSGNIMLCDNSGNIKLCSDISEVGPFTVTFTSGTTPSNIYLHMDYTGPSSSSAEYDAGDGVWTAYSGNSIAMKGDYISFRGDWRTADGNYDSMFYYTFMNTDYNCEFSGTLDYAATTDNAYKNIFRDCSSVVAIHDNPLQPITGSPTYLMFYYAFSGMTGINSSLPDGFLDTSGLINEPGTAMFYCACENMSHATGALPNGFMDTSGLTGSPADDMFYSACRNMSDITSLPDGFMNTSNLTGSPAYAMFHYACDNMSGVTSSLPADFMNTSGLTGEPSLNMFFSACSGMSGVTGSLPANFMNTSGLTGSPSGSMFRYACLDMANVTGALPNGFMDTSGLTGSPTFGMYFYACRGMSSIESGGIVIGSGITLTNSNVAPTLESIFNGCTSWDGLVYWGSDLIYTALTPDSDSDAFKDCTSMTDYLNLHSNWK